MKHLSNRRHRSKAGLLGHISRAAFGLAVVAALAPVRTISKPMILTWGGNSPEWNRILGVSGVRLGCSDAPQSCLNQVDQFAASQGVSSVFLAVLLNPSKITMDTATYAAVSSGHSALKEIGFDDFVSQAQKTKLAPGDLSNLLLQVIGNLKAARSPLKNGVTLYENQIADGQLDQLSLTDAVRQQIDYVHLYQHYRRNSPPISSYVDQVKRRFPNAKIILGVYAYDRREYLPCAHGDPTRCTDQDEIKLFSRTFQQDLDLVKQGVVEGLEFFPGSFGMEESWKGWNNTRSCKPDERSECVQNTKAMRQFVREALAGWSAKR